MPGARPLPKVLVCHPWMGLAGSEVVVAWALQALQDDYEVHLCTASGYNPAQLDKVAGTSLANADIRLVHAPRLPFVRSAGLLPYWHRGRYEEFCRSIAGSYDLCVSGYNPLHFGRPALHLIGDISWYQRLSKEPALWSARRFMSRLLKIAHFIYQGGINHLYFKNGQNDFTPADWFLSNSRWTMDRHRKVVPQVHHDLLYPPVPVDVSAPLPDKPPGRRRRFISLGRVSPEKRIIEKIHMIGQLRALGHDAELVVIGAVGDNTYGESTRRLAAAHADWVTLAGAQYGEDKNRLLREAEFGLHACTDEAFGIAVAELVYHGCLTWVPACSGSAEVVPDPQFHYRDDQGAVKSMDRILRATQPELTTMRQAGRDHVLKNFLPQVFVQRFKEYVAAFRQSQGL